MSVSSKTSQTLSPAAIKDLLPQSGDMLLIAEMKNWSPFEISCTGIAAPAHIHPLSVQAKNGTMKIPASGALEYAAQAIALHGILKARHLQEPPRNTFIAGLQNVEWTSDWLDDRPMPVQIDASAVGGLADGGAKYRFNVTDAALEPVCSGVALVMFSDEERR